MKRCLDEGILQGYLDGELSPEMTQEAASHVAACVPCAEALAEAAQAGALFAAAFGPEEAVRVPTEALRARIEAAVARSEAAEEAAARPRTGWSPGALLAPLTAFFAVTPRQATAFASLLAVVAFAAIFALVQRQPSTDTTRTVSPSQSEIAAVKPPAPAGAGFTTPPVATPDDSAVKSNAPTIVNVKGHRATVRRATVRAERKSAAPALAPEEEKTLLPGEKDYRQAIASLSRTVEAGGDVVLRPAVRADFERNLAVLDKAIAETRRAALRNPKDRDAVDFLMSAYQSKVNLLTTVADQAQVATLGR